MESTITEHKHTGTDSQQVDIRDLYSPHVTAMTTASTATATSVDAAIINNLRTRLNELEAILRLYGLLN